MKIKPEKTGPGEESVWDYPRPPKCEVFNGHIRIILNKEIICETNSAYRVLETSHPPTYYIPIKDFTNVELIKSDKSSFCEFKGRAKYYDFRLNTKTIQACAWQYPDAKGEFAKIQNCVSIYAHQMDQCLVNDRPVKPQEGNFYGGWVTDNIKGPFKGAPGTWGW